MNINIRLLVSLLTFTILLLHFTTTATSAALVHGHRHHHKRRHERNQAQQHIHRTHHRHQAAARSAASTSPMPTSNQQLYVAGYFNSSKLVIIPVLGNKEAFEEKNVKEGVLFFKESNKSKFREKELRDVEIDEIAQVQAEAATWKVAREDKMTFRYWLTVWLVPALLLGVELQ
ncbi:hypothetical protein EG329_014184 [Mollisiaceae sp. DMI_Dod_QoI]|nr:hypothetical protein EG329_014184 [Helotiales sp. DMI_Dod_QoI]